ALLALWNHRARDELLLRRLQRRAPVGRVHPGSGHGAAGRPVLETGRGKSLPSAFDGMIKLKRMLEWQGMELPKHLKDPEPSKQIPLLADVLDGLDEDGYGIGEDGYMSEEDAARAFLEAGGSFDDEELAAVRSGRHWRLPLR
ncbi:unnamed protein product, partial [Prorocentrum cordatum]